MFIGGLAYVGRSRDTDHFQKSLKNHLVQFSPIVCTLKSCRAECTMGENTRDWTNSFLQLLQTMTWVSAPSTFDYLISIVARS